MRRVFVMVVCAMALAGCSGGDEKDTAEAALRRQFDYISKGQWGRHYENMHPAQQAFITRERFIACAEKQGTIQVSNVKVLETFEEETVIPGTDIRAKSTALTIELEASRGGRTEKGKDTFHEYLVDGKWTWVTSGGAEYKEGRCPT